MELKAALLVFLVELIAGVLVFIFCRRRKSELSLAREEMARSLKVHLIQGTLEQRLEDLAAGRVSIYERKKVPAIYLWIGVTMIVGVGLIYAVARFTGAGIVIRTIVGTLSILPFICCVSTAIAEEFDDNSIARFEQNTARQLLTKSREGSIESQINEMLK